MGCGDVDYVDVRVLDEFVVGAIGFRSARSLHFFEELGGAGNGGGRAGSDDDMLDILDIATGGVGEKVSYECCEILASAKRRVRVEWRYRLQCLLLRGYPNAR